MLGALAFGKYQPITRKQLLNGMFAGVVMLGFGGGLVFWALQFIDTGFTALVISGQPLVIVFMMWALQGKKPHKQAYLGILLGMIGMYLLVNQSTLITHPDQWIGISVVFLSMLSWGYGTLFVGQADMPKPQAINSAIQMMTGGVVLVTASFIVEDPGSVNWTALQPMTLMAMSYLIVFGSIIAFSSFTFLLSKVSPEKVATSTYVNPIVAMFLGWFFRNELITTQSMLAAAIMLTGVFFINAKPEYSKQLWRRFRLAGKR